MFVCLFVWRKVLGVGLFVVVVIVGDVGDVDVDGDVVCVVAFCGVDVVVVVQVVVVAADGPAIESFMARHWPS